MKNDSNFSFSGFPSAFNALLLLSYLLSLGSGVFHLHYRHFHTNACHDKTYSSQPLHQAGHDFSSCSISDNFRSLHQWLAVQSQIHIYGQKTVFRQLAESESYSPVNLSIRTSRAPPTLISFFS